MTGPRLALWGTFDVPRLADVLAPRLLARELEARLPGATVEALAPRGGDLDEPAPFPLDGGLPPTAAGRPGPVRDALLADAFDLVVIVGEPPSSPAENGPCPVVRLSTFLPDPSDLLLLASRHTDAEVLARRRRYLAHLGWWPAEAPAVVQGDGTALADLEAIANALESTAAPVLLLTTGPAGDDTTFLDALAARLPLARRPETPTLEEMLAALAAARLVVASSAGARAAALSFGIPSVAPGADLAERIREGVHAPAPDLAPLDAALERIATLARESAEHRRPGSSVAAAAAARHEELERAFAAQGRLFAAERLRLAERVERLAAGWDPEEARRGIEAHDELVSLRERLAATEAKRAQLEEWLESNVAAARQTSVWLDSTEAERKRLEAELQAVRATFDAERGRMAEERTRHERAAEETRLALDAARAEVERLRSAPAPPPATPPRGLLGRLRGR